MAIESVNLADQAFSTSDVASLAVAGGMMFFVFILAIVTYIALAISLLRIAKKTGTANAWFAWVPILNIILTLNIARFSGWWLLLFLIPIVGWFAFPFFMIYVWMKIAAACGKPDFLGIFIIIPIGQIVLPLYLAFSE
ncbi:hypothetical protein HYV44_02005 [Candidatus Microgenomates bacterium]|nr:hypothetical protein [Candidatus Microgenomates bacterium]